MSNDELIGHVLRTNGFLFAREHPDLRNALSRACRAGRLVRVLPGVYTDAGMQHDMHIRIAAVRRWDPSATICGRAAAAISYWPGIRVDQIEVASPVRHRPQPGFEFAERRIPPDLATQIGGVTLTTPSLTAMDLATFDFTDPIDVALRKRAVTLATMQDAVDRTSGRRGHRDRRRVLLDSRAEPWSRAEREAHRLFRREGISGWVANHEVTVPDVGTYYLDIAFRRERVAVEIDGRLHERELFESDRYRQNDLVSDWTIIRFTWQMLTENPDYVVHTTKVTLANATRALRRA